ncbi:MAG: hypothetical protein ACRCUM_03850 [Mycoplasmoidaceae bacterium]
MNNDRYKKYQQKRKFVRQALKIDYKERVITLLWNGEEKSFILGSKTPLLSFSSCTRGLFGVSIPKNILETTSTIGTQVMENIESRNLIGEYLHEDEKVLVCNALIEEWLLYNNLEVKAVEKMFISPCEKYYGYIDLIVQHKTSREFFIVEVKTRGSSFREFTNLNRAQAQWYKEHFYNVRTILLAVNRDYDITKKKELKGNWKFVEEEVRKCSNFTNIIKMFNDVDNWHRYNQINTKYKDIKKVESN